MSNSCCSILEGGSVAWELLHSWIPQRYQLGHTVKLVYSTIDHGTALRTLCARAKQAEVEACVLLYVCLFVFSCLFVFDDVNLLC
jgi:hypothetical protein